MIFLKHKKVKQFTIWEGGGEETSWIIQTPLLSDFET